MSEKYGYTEQEIKQKKQKIYEDMEKSVSEQNDKLSEYDNSVSMGLGKKSVDTTTDEELLDAVKKRLAEKYGSLAEQANYDSKQKAKSLADKIAAAEKQAEEKLKSVDETYKDAVKSVENDAVKRGIQRSSIANGGIAALEKSKAEALGEVNKQKEAEKKSLAEQIDALKSRLETLLADYDKQRESEEESEFTAAKKQRDDANDKAVEFNNKVIEKEAEYADSHHGEDYERTVYNIKKTYGVSRLDEVVNFYRTFADKSAALEDFISDDKWKSYLGDYYSKALRLIYNM